MPHARRLTLWFALIGSGAAGSLVAVQSRINGGLGRALDDGYLAATISFVVGLAVILVVFAFSRRAKIGLSQLRHELRSGRFPWWALLGGVCGAFFVLGQGLIAPVLGVALFTVGGVAGQVLGGLIFDRMGLGPGGRVSTTAPRLIGTVLAVLAVVLTVLADLFGASMSATTAWLVLVPMLAGLGTAWQSAVNGLVRAATKSAVTTTVVSFSAGTIVLLAASAVSIGVRGWPVSWPSEPVLYVGGSIGVIFIALSAVLVRVVGVLLLGMANVAGQLVGSVVLEAGLPLAGGVTAGLLAGAAVALVAVVIAALPGRSKRGEGEVSS